MLTEHMKEEEEKVKISETVEHSAADNLSPGKDTFKHDDSNLVHD